MTLFAQRTFRLICAALVLGSWATPSEGRVTRGLYINSATIVKLTDKVDEDGNRLTRAQELMPEFLAAGINTLVVDFHYSTSDMRDWQRRRYESNLALFKSHGMTVLARVIVFPYGGNYRQLRDRAIWRKKLKIMKSALAIGADGIQLDYIRYSDKEPARSQNVYDVRRVVRYFAKHLPKNKTLEAAVFGITAIRPELSIGQDVTVLGPELSVLSPMNYPSHYANFRKTSADPYGTLRDAMIGMNEQLFGITGPKVVPYVEVYNYRYPNWGREKRMCYVSAQIKAAMDHGADGYIVWSAKNRYGYLFDALLDPPDLAACYPDSSTEPMVAEDDDDSFEVLSPVHDKSPANRLD